MEEFIFSYSFVRNGVLVEFLIKFPMAQFSISIGMVHKKHDIIYLFIFTETK